jgi:ABC-type dipeptide/oligopeptide/nickel transport system permease component
MQKRIIYRIIFLILAILFIPVVPILIIFAGVSSPEYIIRGTLNIDLSQIEMMNYWEIYTIFLSNIVRFNLGTSTASGQSVISIVSSGMLESLKIIIPSIIISFIIGTLIGIWTEKSRRANSVWHKLQFTFYIPMIVISYLLLYFLSYIGVDFLSNIKYITAMMVLSIYPIYVITNALKKTLQELGNSNFFLFHSALGFDRGEIWKKFCYKFIVIDYLSFFENILIFMIGFLYFVETPFGIHGMGYKFVIAIHRFDYPVVIGFCILGIILLSIVGLIVEPVKSKLDPRGVSV